MSKLNNKKRFLAPLAASIGAAALATSLSVSSLQAAENPFTTTNLGSGFMLAESGDKASEGKCGEGKCGEKKDHKDKKGKKGAEGKCGEGKCGEGKCGAESKDAEGKCGEGKCGGAQS